MRPRGTEVLTPEKGFVTVLVLVSGTTMVMRVNFAFKCVSWLLVCFATVLLSRQHLRRALSIQISLSPQVQRHTEALVRHGGSKKKVGVDFVDLHVEKDPTLMKYSLPRVASIVAGPVKVSCALKNYVRSRAFLLDDDGRNVSVGTGARDRARVSLFLVTMRLVDPKLLGGVNESMTNRTIKQDRKETEEEG